MQFNTAGRRMRPDKVSSLTTGVSLKSPDNFKHKFAIFFYSFEQNPSVAQQNDMSI